MRKISHRIVEYCAHHPNFQRQFDKQSNQNQNSKHPISTVGQVRFSLIPNRFNGLKKNEMQSGVTLLIYPARFIKTESHFTNT